MYLKFYIVKFEVSKIIFILIVIREHEDFSSWENIQNLFI